ncbi:MAG TPA: hypothetical protein DDY37_07190 [Legionella sp.]|nr:hypothetical protein [Legionella sp.]
MPVDPLLFGLKESTINQIKEVFSSYPGIEKAVIYGSRAKGNYRNGSDIDITLLGESLTYEQLNRIETQLDDLMLVYSIDLSLFKYIDAPDLIEHINRVGQVLYLSSMA